MTEDEIKDCLLDFAQNGIFQPLPHCARQMRLRNVYFEDIINVFQFGTITNHGFDRKYQNWKCEVEGHDLDGDGLNVMAAVDEDCYKVLCITVLQRRLP